MMNKAKYLMKRVHEVVVPDVKLMADLSKALGDQLKENERLRTKLDAANIEITKLKAQQRPLSPLSRMRH